MSAEEMPADRYGFKPTPTSWDLVAYLKSSLDYCQANLKAMRDSQLGETFEVKGAAGKVNHVTQAELVVVLLDDWSDHYSQQAQDLRLNGLLPPLAQPRPKARRSRAALWLRSTKPYCAPFPTWRGDRPSACKIGRAQRRRGAPAPGDGV